MVDAIEVTDEMRQAGADVIDAADERDDRWAREHISVAIYRAMRVLEAKPVDRVERKPFKIHEEEEIDPEAAEVLGNNAQIPAKEISPRHGFNPTEQGVSQPGQFGTPYPQGAGQQFAAGPFPKDFQTRVFEAPLEAEVGPVAPKFCKDCRWMESMPPGISWNAGPRCLQRLGRDWNLVTGEGTQPHCVYARMQSEKCGSDARWFEPRGASDA